MSDPTPTVTHDILARHGYAVPADEQPVLLATIATMQEYAAVLYAVPAARYEDPAIGWDPVV